MKTFFFLAVALAVEAQAREPESLAALVDEMAVLERVLGAALNSETSGSAEYRSGMRALQDRTGVNLRPWLQDSVSAIEAEYLAWQGILVSLELSREPTVRDFPNAFFTTVARTGDPRLPMLLASLTPEDFAELKRLVDERDDQRRRLIELTRVVSPNADRSGESVGPQDNEAIRRELGALRAREPELLNAINAEVKRLRELIEPRQQTSTDDVHAALVEAVCDYALLKYLPDDERLTLRVRQSKGPIERETLGSQWTYHVLAKQDVVECRQGAIDAEELRHRAYVYRLITRETGLPSVLSRRARLEEIP
ncbi:MAG: hypothetical protein OXP36_00360 [Gammaproteobacteria bacterium]|nr:hypothetical protein [Gammaproteobacteria bacterium]